MVIKFPNKEQKVEVCFFCKTVTGDIPKSKYRAIKTEFNYEPCEKCKEKWEQGVPVLEMSKTPLMEGQPPLEEGVDAYPTGRYMVMNREALEMDEDTNIVLMLQEDFEAVLKSAQEVMEGKE